MRREAYLGMLALVSVMLLDMLHEMGTAFGLTHPVWVGAVLNLLYQCGAQQMLVAIVGSIASGFFAMQTRTRAHIISPTILAFGGFLTFLVMSFFHQVSKWYNIEYVHLPDHHTVSYGTIPTVYSTPYFLCNTIPLVVTLFSLGPYPSERVPAGHVRESVAKGRERCSRREDSVGSRPSRREGRTVPTVPTVRTAADGPRPAGLTF
jgi:hypothetical protein